jgi:MurNAc alpha-1-phosphate uridylyltransferase
MILAAGRGERMRPLTDHCPKPMLRAGGVPLVGWHLAALAEAGFTDVVINHAHCGEVLVDWVGNGSRWGLSVMYSPESPALETAGGIRHALPLLGNDPFLVINGDVFTRWPVERARIIGQQMSASDLLGWCVLVPNPDHHPAGDFTLESGLLGLNSDARLTFSGIGVYQPALFAALADGEPAKLGPILRAAAKQRQIGAERWDGIWTDVGTPERLAQLDAELSVGSAVAPLPNPSQP